MARYPTPDREGHYWAKLVHPTKMPAGNDWRSLDWEVVFVVHNGGDNPNEEWGVLVTGVGPMQWLVDCVWGPRVDMPPELGKPVVPLSSLVRGGPAAKTKPDNFAVGNSTVKFYKD